MELTRELRDKRVAIAKDVLLQMGRGYRALQVKRGMYFNFDSDEFDDIVDEGLQENVDFVQDNCQVCALGACVLSKARLYDEIGVEVLQFETADVARAAVVNALADVFDVETIDCIEAAFEETTRHASDPFMVRVAHASCSLESIKAEDRLREIMQNIIDHDGEFVVD